MWREDRAQFDRIAAQLVHKTLADRANESATCATQKSRPPNEASDLGITRLLLFVPLVFVLVFLIIRVLVGFA